MAIRQLDGAYAVRSPQIYPLWRSAIREANAFADLQFRWVRRENNAEADALTRVAYRNSIPEEQRRANKVARIERAAALVSGVVAGSDGQWTVLSASGRNRYAVHLGEASSCTCPDFRKRNEVCKHIVAVQMA
ncbi:MAG: SWIM zinc finger family protein, partial [Acidimicrobiales bacterium]